MLVDKASQREERRRLRQKDHEAVLRQRAKRRDKYIAKLIAEGESWVMSHVFRIEGVDGELGKTCRFVVEVGHTLHPPAMSSWPHQGNLSFWPTSSERRRLSRGKPRLRPVE